jgi:hypothetical protein
LVPAREKNDYGHDASNGEKAEQPHPALIIEA